MRYDPDLDVTPAPADPANAGDQPITLESLVHILRERGMLETTFIEVLPGPDAAPTKVH